MADQRQRGERAIALFAAGVVALGYPVVGLLSGGEVFGAPRLFVYLFLAWLAIIVLLALIVRDSASKPAADSRGSRH